MKFFDHFSWELFKESFVGIWILFFFSGKKSLLSNFRSSQLKIIAWQFCFSLKSCRAQAGTPANSGSRKQFSKKSAPQPKQNHAYCPENENMGAFFTTPWDWLCRGNQVQPRWRTFCLWKFFIVVQFWEEDKRKVAWGETRTLRFKGKTIFSKISFALGLPTRVTRVRITRVWGVNTRFWIPKTGATKLSCLKTTHKKSTSFAFYYVNKIRVKLDLDSKICVNSQNCCYHDSSLVEVFFFPHTQLVGSIIDVDLTFACPSHEEV